MIPQHFQCIECGTVIERASENPVGEGYCEAFYCWNCNLIRPHKEVTAKVLSEQVLYNLMSLEAGLDQSGFAYAE